MMNVDKNIRNLNDVIFFYIFVRFVYFVLLVYCNVNLMSYC